MSREIKFRALYEGVWYYQTLEEMLTITLAAFRNGNHKTQFTGLLDKNVKEIYEGDILENDNGVKYVVVWIEQLAAFYLSIPNTQRGKEFISCAASKVANEPMLLFKEAVIGNIYENTELLSTQKQ